MQKIRTLLSDYLLSNHRQTTSGIFLSLLLILPANANLPELGDPTLDSFSSKAERQLGLAFYRSLRANLAFVDDHQINDYLSSIGQRLASHSDAAGDNFHFFIINAASINAFAGPAAYIGIHTGLILEADNESQLASVLAHEIAHVSQRHLARAFDNSGQSTAITFATLLAAILVGSQDAQAGQAVLLSGLASTQQTAINFTRRNEQEADRVGIRVLSDTGINPKGMVEFFETLLAKSSDSGIEYLRTHPLNSSRVSEAKNRLTKKGEKLPRDTLDFQLAKARLAVLLSKQPLTYLNDNTTNNTKSNKLITQYQKALAAIRTQKYDLAIKILRSQIKKHQHPWLPLALAEAYTGKKQDGKALNTLSTLADLYPSYLPVSMAYVHTLNNNQQPEKSISVLKRQLQSNDSAMVHKALAKAYFANGQISAALESTGNQYVRQGYDELAIQQYDNALKQQGISESTKQRLQSVKKEIKQRMKRLKERD
jgi:predicted Zn-dependent protease